MLAARPWVPDHCEDRVTDIATRTATQSTQDIADRVQALADQNRDIHERECFNLNPATNVLSPRAEAILSAGIGSRPSLGYPGDKYEMGLEAIEEIEVIAAELCAQVFDAKYAEIRMPSGAIANMYGFMATCKAGDTIIAPPATIGGHVTHHADGCAGLFGLKTINAPFDAKGFTLDLNALRKLALDVKPKLITVGGSLNLFEHPVAEVRAIADEVGAILMVDAAHFIGLVAGKAIPSPVPYADVVTFTTHKVLRGPRGGMMLCKAEHAKAVDKAVFPMMQGGPLMHGVAAKAVALREAATPEYQQYASQVIRNAQTLCEGLAEHGMRPTSGGTDTHLALIDLQSIGVTGADAETRCDAARITLNKNAIPYDPRPPSVGSGIRVGTPSVTTQGMLENDMREIADLIHRAVTDADGSAAADISVEVGKLVERHPAYPRDQRTTD